VSTWTPSWSPRHSGLTEARDTSSTDHVLLEVHRSASSPTARECARAMKQIPHGHTGLSSHSSCRSGRWSAVGLRDDRTQNIRFGVTQRGRPGIQVGEHSGGYLKSSADNAW
jgi:hypothetical protein